MYHVINFQIVYGSPSSWIYIKWSKKICCVNSYVVVSI